MQLNPLCLSPRCTARNSEGEANLNLKVVVSRRLHLEIQPNSVTAHVGSRLELRCVSLPPVDGMVTTWVKDGNILVSRGRYSVKGATLTGKLVYKDYKTIPGVSKNEFVLTQAPIGIRLPYVKSLAQKPGAEP